MKIKHPQKSISSQNIGLNLIRFFICPSYSVEVQDRRDLWPLVNSTNFQIRQIPAKEQYFFGNNKLYSIKPAVMRIKISKK